MTAQGMLLQVQKDKDSKEKQHMQYMEESNTRLKALQDQIQQEQTQQLLIVSDYQKEMQRLDTSIQELQRQVADLSSPAH
eukprot:2626800-Karenia_brevis.AAC.1